jgi:DNA-dependent RNA polymerase auxiliary subunit epsilon
MLISVTKSDNTKYESENVDLSKLLEYNCEFCSLLEESEIECEKSNECIEVF